MKIRHEYCPSCGYQEPVKTEPDGNAIAVRCVVCEFVISRDLVNQPNPKPKPAPQNTSVEKGRELFAQLRLEVFGG